MNDEPSQPTVHLRAIPPIRFLQSNGNSATARGSTGDFRMMIPMRRRLKFCSDFVFKFIIIQVVGLGQQQKGVVKYFEKYRNEGFASSMDTAKTIACEMNIDPTFLIKRRIIRKKQFDENNSEEEMQASEEEAFRVNYFLTIVDMAISSLNNIFEQLKKFESIFGFLFDSDKLKSLDENELMRSCVHFGDTFYHNTVADVDVNDLYSELKVLQVTLPNKSMTAIEILEFVKVVDCYPNVSVAYRIMLTVPVTVASAEMSFSKLKLLKTYLRSSMSQERLNGLAILCIEKDMFDNIDLDVITDDFTSKNARRICFV
ncbi:zinc finger MYM-type protein 1-like [Cynara cardunculus var. scolymus]|uniref:zinc finger MYM-type protein 1-like n=1 Tax=Cynara cardunculus var. scolymus TaxID=59895 RepID=UPI000D6242F7|nr:zinc finger MYM-type protein 1-like [Cynara cardunculus var. scolymus]